MNQENNNNNNNQNNGGKRGFHNRRHRPHHGNRPQGQNQGGQQGPRQAQGRENAQNQGAEPGQGQNPQSGQPRRENNRFQGRGGQHHRGHNNHHGRHQNRGHGHNRQEQTHRHDLRPKTGVDAIYDRYYQLVQDYVNARKKYYEFYYRADDNQMRKIEDQYHRSIFALRDFEKGLEEWKKEFLLKKVDMFKFDTTYSENRKYVEGPQKGHYGLLPIQVENPGEGPFENPHVLQTQIQRQSYKDDTEESVGTIEDYKRLKGL